jgi:acid phosphatase
MPRIPDATLRPASGTIPARVRRGSFSKLVAALFVLLLVVILGWLVVLEVRRGEHLTALEPVPARTTVSVPAFRHVYLIVLENKNESEVVTSADAPYFDSLIDRFGLATNYQGIAHPSQPNYLVLFSGSTHDVLDDDVHDVMAGSLADQLEAAGKTWRVFAENYPGEGCFAGASSSDGPDGAGLYVRKHNPAISFSSINGSADRCRNIQPLGSFDPAVADFEMIVPNMCHVMHDCPVADGDAWLRAFVPKILDSAAWADGGVLFITFDEGSDRSATNRVATLIAAPDVAAGTTSDTAHSHYSLLRTIEAGLGVPCLADACAANTLGEFFTR